MHCNPVPVSPGILQGNFDTDAVHPDPQRRSRSYWRLRREKAARYPRCPEAARETAAFGQTKWIGPECPTRIRTPSGRQ